MLPPSSTKAGKPSLKFAFSPRRRGATILAIGVVTLLIFLFTLIENAHLRTRLIAASDPSSVALTDILDAAAAGVPVSAWRERRLRVPFSPPPRYIPGLKCVQVVGRRGLQSIEGMGAVFRLNQLAPFLASYYGARLAFPSKMSEHSYDIADFFSDCGYRKTFESFPEHCVVDERRIYFEICPRTDCACIASQYHEHVMDRVHQGCSVVGVLSDRYKTLECSGCMGDLMRVYFGTQGPEPRWKYDVIHYRMGDLAAKPGGKSFSQWELAHLISAMCDLSDRDIVVITEGRPKIPQCERKDGTPRIVLAADTKMEEAFQITQHAHTLSVGLSGFAFLIAEIAQPTRMVVLDWHARFYRWIDCEKWTLVTKGNSVFHFGTKAHMEFYAMSPSNLERELRFLNPGDVKWLKYNWTVPTRMWSRTAMRPAILPLLRQPGASKS